MYVRISPGSAAARPSSLKAFDWTLVATLRLSASCRRNAPFMPELLSLALAPGPGQGFLYPVARAIRSQGGVLWQLGFQARVLDAPVARLPQQPRRAGPPRPGPHRPPGPSASTLPVPAGAPPAKARSLEISSSLKLAAAPKSFARAVHLSRSLAPGSASRVHGSSGVVAPARPVHQHRAPRPRDPPPPPVRWRSTPGQSRGPVGPPSERRHPERRPSKVGSEWRPARSLMPRKA